jgi:tRNA/tmRNA/rRNA uracil-C5-methylase (TrmA/RlmC/RlmD family)
VVFVRHALPGERVTALVTEDRGGSSCRADAIDILEPSPDRAVPPCRYAHPGGCGGCDLQHVAPAAQRRAKLSVVREQLTRLGGLDEADLKAVGLDTGAEAEELPGGMLGWRTRVRFAVDADGRAGLHPQRSDVVLPIDRCLIASRGVDELGITDLRWPGVSTVDGVASSGGDTAIVVRPSEGDRPVLPHLPPEIAVLDAGGRGPARPLRGHARVRERAAGREWQVHAAGFWQVHPGAADALTGAVRAMLEPRPGERALDLYAGVGLFAAVLAEGVGERGTVTAVESDHAAVAAARRNLRDLDRITVVSARVDHWLRGSSGTCDLVVLDPPRSGAGALVVKQLAKLRPRAIAYVACDPAALARDVRTFIGLGWRLRAVRVLDLFPMTAHVECVALLEPIDRGVRHDGGSTAPGASRGSLRVVH